MQARAVGTRNGVNAQKKQSRLEQEMDAAAEEEEQAATEGRRSLAATLWRLLGLEALAARDALREFPPAGAVCAAELDDAASLAGCYLRCVVAPAQRCLPSRTFQWTVNAAIVVAVLMVGISSYVDPEPPEPPMTAPLKAAFEPILLGFDLAVTAGFTAEVLARLSVRGPRVW